MVVVRTVGFPDSFQLPYTGDVCGYAVSFCFRGKKHTKTAAFDTDIHSQKTLMHTFSQCFSVKALSKESKRGDLKCSFDL